MANKELYLDNAATTKVRKEVVKAMEEYMLNEYGNPSSSHELGEKARKAIDDARIKFAREINANPGEIVFTSGGTEANNLAILGLAKANPGKKVIIIGSIEHPSVGEPCVNLEKQGYNVIKIAVNREGIIKIDELDKELSKNRDVLLVSTMHVNNIIGTIQPIEEIGALCRKHKVAFHTDAVQSFGKLDIDVKKMNIDLLSASGHKINGPKGSGLLYIKKGIKIEPLIYGGGQEKGLRSGTENVPGIIGMVRALEIIGKVDKNKIKRIRDKFIEELKKIGGRINGSVKNRIHNNINVSFSGMDNDTLVQFLSSRGVYVSAGSACESKKEKEEKTLEEIGLDEKEQKGSIRITINEEIMEKDINRVVKEIKQFQKINR